MTANLLKQEAIIVGDDSWIETFTGGRFYLNHDEDLDQINVEDIGHALSMNCRYNGHSHEFYSVAEHSVLISMLVPKEIALQGLLHDATEAYLSDICRPFKKHLKDYDKLEDRVYHRIATKYGLPAELDKRIKFYDVAICRLEAERFMKSKAFGWGIPVDSLPLAEFQEKTGFEHIPCWEWREAKQRFYDRFTELSGL
jgi:hypothetical protein